MQFIDTITWKKQEAANKNRINRINAKSKAAYPRIRTQITKLREKNETTRVSKLATQTYTLSYLILFSFLGTLARIGLTALTFYPNTPVLFTTIWANFGGSLIMGFLTEGRMLFQHEWGILTYDEQLARARRAEMGEGSGSSSSRTVIDLSAAKKAHPSTQKTVPLYIGLTTGFCGSFTSFSTFIRDVLLALSDN